MKRAYSLLEIRSSDEATRTIEGIASTPEIDSYNTVLEPEGALFRLPMPVLYQHNARQPIGHVVDAKVTERGIHVRMKIASPGIATFIDEAWNLIKAGLVRGLSVGFEPLEEVFDKSFNGFRYPKWRWLELSTVTIAANEGASMTSVRAADEALLAALGTKERQPAVRLNLNSPASGPTRTNEMKKPIREQMADFEAKRTANQTAMDEMMDKASEESRGLDADEDENYKTLKSENLQIDAHLARMKEHEASMLSRATQVTTTTLPNGNPEKEGQQVRIGAPIQVRSMAPKGIGVARAAIALYHSGGVKALATDFARKRWPDDGGVEQVINYQLRAGVDAGDTTTSGWASQLISGATNAPGEFLEMLRAATILGKISGFRRVPFNVAVPVQSGAGTYNWVGEAAGKPVTSLTFASVTLRWAKAAGIIVITEELAKFSTPSAEMIIRDEMIQGLTRFLDAQFIGTQAAVANVSPAGILNGVSSTAVTGTAATNFRTDMNNMLNNFTAANQDPTQITLIMSATQAMALSLMVTDLGVSLFPNISLGGGTILGMPVVISEAVGTKIIALIPSQIFIAEDGGIEINVSREASVEMETAPAVGEQSPLSTLTNYKSLWQNNLVGFRVERYQTWVVGRTSAVEYITANAYVP